MRFSMFEKTVIGFMAAAWLVWGVNFAGDILVRAEPLKKPVFEAPEAEKATETATAPDAAPSATATTESAPAAAAPAPKAAGGVMAMLSGADVAAGGQRVYKKCKACHSADKNGKNRVGPNLWDIVGKAKAAAAGFKYSGALKGLGGEWSYQDLDAFLAAPKAFAKGTKMSFKGLKKAKDRAAIIAYLRSLSDQPKPLP